MPTKKYILDFAHPEIKARDRIADITKAVKHAGLNLESRYGIVIHNPVIAENNSVMLTVDIPDGKESSFDNAGNRLRGIAVYLIKKCSFPYKNYTVGARLLTYSEWNTVDESDECFEHWTPICITPDGREFYLVERLKNGTENNG